MQGGLMQRARKRLKIRKAIALTQEFLRGAIAWDTI
jgi:hypothetical protein